MVRKYIYNSLMLVVLLCSTICFGQTRKEKKADRDFEGYAYIDAIKVYESIAEQGYINTSILSKLGDSYYFNGLFSDAYKWYDKLFNASYEDKNLGALNSEYYYRYAQTLKAINQPSKADEVLMQFNELEASDSRAILFLPTESVIEETMSASRFAFSNLTINSPHSDYGATLVDNQLIFTSARTNEEMRNKVHKWTNDNYTKLYSSTISTNGDFEEAVLYAKEITSKELNIGSAVFTKNGNTMYFTSNYGSARGGKKTQYNEDNSSLLKIYKATKQGNGSWGSVEELPFNVDGFNTAHPALTPDEQWMYFASDRRGTLGQSDIFRIGIYDNGKFGQLENVGIEINTAGRETFPFISSDFMLYFSSDGHPGFGGLDLFKAKINRDGTLGVAINLGPDINSPVDDFGFYIDTSTQKGFFTTNKEGGNGGDDIYLFIEKPCVQTLDVLVLDKDTKEVIEGAELIMYDKNRQQIDVAQTNERGFYNIKTLNCGSKYRIRAIKEGYLTQELVVDTDRKLKQHLNIHLEVDGTKIETGDDLFKKLKLEPIYFDFDKADIRRDAQFELMKIVEVMRQYPDLLLDVRSHTDSRGNDAYNLALSERRAQATVQWMIERGIDSNRLTGMGYGETRLLNACSNGIPCTDEEHQLNRRSEFIIVNM